MTRQILAIGEMNVAFTALPTGGGEDLYARRSEGKALQVALALCRLSVPCALSGVIYSDALGQAVYSDAEKAGIDVSKIVISEGHTGISVRDINGREMFCCPAKGMEKPSLGEEKISLRTDGVTYFSADSLQNEMYLMLYRAVACNRAQKDDVLILDCTGCTNMPEQQLLEKADVLCLDDQALRFYGMKSELLHGNTQAVVALEHEEVTIVTVQGTLEFPVVENMRTGKDSFGVVAVLYQIYAASMKRADLSHFFADISFVKTLARCIIAACRVPMDQGETLRNAILLAPEGTGQVLAFAQKKMDEMAPAVERSKWRLQYHIAAPSGWINDPNGLIQVDGVYHVFYQLHPFSPEWGPMYWGHVTSRDLAHWHHEPIALAPDQPYEAGCFSGSAVNDKGIITLLYTAHNDGNTIKECQCIARSHDGGRTFEKSPANPVLPHYPKDGSADFRDPKVWRQDGRWQMIIGSGKHRKGRALLYASADLEHWEYRGIMCESDGTQGVMWECPNFCTVDGRDVLIFSPMEMKKHKNVYSVGVFDNKIGKFTPACCRELDHGLNYYAAQIFEDEQKRTILIAWMDMWGADFPTQEDGWAGALTLPRVLHMRGDTLLQQPVPELTALRMECLQEGGFIVKKGENPLRELKGDCMEIFMRFDQASACSGFDLGLRSDAVSGRRALLRYDGQRKAFAMPHGLISEKEHVHLEYIPCEIRNGQIDVHIYVDKCSIEVFIDEGALCFTQRVYPSSEGVFYKLAADGLRVLEFEVWSLGNAFE